MMPPAGAPGALGLLVDEHPHPQRVGLSQPGGSHYRRGHFCDQAAVRRSDTAPCGTVTSTRNRGASSAAVVCAPAGSSCR
jgi:hypothetical protein